MVSAWQLPHTNHLMAHSRKVVPPGPGAYDVRTADRFRSDIVRVPVYNTVSAATAPKFTMSNTKSEMDWIVKRAAACPSSQQYGNTTPMALKNTSTFHSAQAGGYMTRSNGVNTEAMNRARRADFPGPGHYGNPHTSVMAGGRISNSRIVTDLDVHLREHKGLPGPGQYPLPHVDRYRRTTEPMAGRFGVSALSAGSMYSCLVHTPSPDRYYNPKMTCLTDTGGKISTSHRATELEAVIKMANSRPGPAHYSAETSYGAFNNKYLWQPYNTQAQNIQRRLDAAGDVSDLRSTLGATYRRSIHAQNEFATDCDITSPLDDRYSHLMTRMRVLTAPGKQSPTRSYNTRPW